MNERRRDLATGILLGLAVFLAFNANRRVISSGDAFPARYLPFGILEHGTLSLDPLASVVAQGRPATAYWIVPGRGGHLFSMYPIVLPLLVTPMYVPAVAYLHLRGWTLARLDRVARIMEKLTASLIASAATVVLFLALRRRTSRRWAAALALVFALGTTTWVTSSQGMWQHALGQLLVAGALFLVTGPCSDRRALAFGLLCGLLPCNRPPDAILAAGLVAVGALWSGRRLLLVGVAAAVPAVLTLAYNLATVGRVAGGYALRGDARFFQYPLIPGLAGLLFSPAKGLFVFSPFLLAVPFGIRRLLRETRDRPRTLLIGLTVLVQILFYAKADWRAGFSWGPRWMTDLLPLLFWLLPPIVSSLGVAARTLFALACGVAVAIECVGAFWYTGASDLAIKAGATDSSLFRGAWRVENTPFLSELRHGPAPPELFLKMDGAIEGVDLASGDAITAVGWTLAGGKTPSEVVAFLDGVLAGSTTTFTARPDVEAAMRVASSAGWRLRIRTESLAPGEHVLGIQAKAGENGDWRFVGEKTIRLGGASDLDPAAREAERALREHQDPAGYWLTSHTSTTRFEQPSREMNTYLTAMLVDLLDPIAADVHLEESVARARGHLTAQIEPGGLVRYHGLPDSPTIGRLGCAITPDTDDTALVWRVAPGRPDALREALATIGRYRRDDGLYRTWLAPRDAFRCIDPGADPNPADVGIQMHLLLLLSKADPPASQRLCRALESRGDDERTWVYYRLAPLVPVLRHADLEAAGCALRLPEARLRSTIPGQETWVTICRLLAKARRREMSPPEREEALAALRAVSGDHFALLHCTPPLLYHNDLTASIPRFYWSEDFGYAVWLGLHREYARRR